MGIAEPRATSHGTSWLATIDSNERALPLTSSISRFEHARIAGVRPVVRKDTGSRREGPFLQKEGGAGADAA